MPKAIIALETLIKGNWEQTQQQEINNNSDELPPPLQSLEFNNSKLVLRVKRCLTLVGTPENAVNIEIPNLSKINISPDASVTISGCCPIHRVVITNQS
jgi:hypothetical protein